MIHKQLVKACMIFWEVNIENLEVAYTISTLSMVKGILTGTIPYTREFSKINQFWCTLYNKLLFPCKVTQCLIKLSDLQGMVEAGGLKPVTFTWTPPAGHDVSNQRNAFILLWTAITNIFVWSFFLSDLNNSIWF